MPEYHTVMSLSLGEDGAYMAMADAASAATVAGADYRIVGGHMVSAHVARSGLDLPPRETADADLALETMVLAGMDLVGELGTRGYAQVAGNRFTRRVDDTELTVDVLVPADTSRVRHNRTVGQLTVDEIPVLRYALSRRPAEMNFTVQLASGGDLDMTVRFPDAVAALCLKADAYASRREPRDAFDVWRLLEVLNADGMTARAWPQTATPRDAAALLRRDFMAHSGSGMRAAAASKDQQTRIAALVMAIIGRP
jgi:hypothetical protein